MAFAEASFGEIGVDELICDFFEDKASRLG